MAKRNAHGSGSLRQRSDGRWEARFTYQDELGQPKRGSVYGATQKEARQKLTAALKAVDEGTYQKPNHITVAAWMGEWLEVYARPTVKPLTYSAYQTSIRTHIVPAIGSVKLQSLRGSHVQRLYSQMIETGSSPKTVKNAGAILHKALAVAVKQGLLPRNPCDAAELPKGRTREIRPLSDAEIPLFLEAIRGDTMQNAFALCLFTGLREGECLGLSWPQVDFDAGRLTVSQQLQKERGGGYYLAPYTKSSKPRTIEPPPIAFEFLRAEQQKQAEERLRAGAAWTNPWELVFTNALGQHLVPQTFYAHFKRIAASIGRPDARPHDLRHTAATVAIASGASVKAVQALLGHSTASITLNVYTHPSERMMRDASERVQAYYDSLQKKA